jgi:tellurium resistance protein TerD
MAINLKKGQRVDISLENLAVGLGWTGDSDLDASAFMLGNNGQVPVEEFFVFYNNLESKDMAVHHSGDDKVGGTGDVETIKVDIRKLDPRIEQIIFTVTIHDAESTGENFGQVRNSFIRIYNADNNEELCKYELDEDFSVETAIVFGRLYKRNDVWRFEAIGTAGAVGLESFVKQYATAYS